MVRTELDKCKFYSKLNILCFIFIIFSLTQFQSIELSCHLDVVLNSELSVDCGIFLFTFKVS